MRIQHVNKPERHIIQVLVIDENQEFDNVHISLS